MKEQVIASLENKLEVGEFRLHSLLEITRAITTNQSVEQLTRLFAFIMQVILKSSLKCQLFTLILPFYRLTEMVH